MIRTLVSNSVEQTFTLGERLGRLLTSGDFVGLDGELGAGKTLFSRGVAAGAGVPLDDVSSPTYSILQTYRGRLTLHHADLYRLRSEHDLFATGYFDLMESQGAMLVEWASMIPAAVASDALLIRIEVTPGDTRRLVAQASGPRSEALLGQWQPDSP